MKNFPRILLHNDETASLAHRLREAFPEVEVTECNSYRALPEAISSFRPAVVYTVRFAGTPGYPRDALFAEGGPKWVATGGAGTDHLSTWDVSRTTVTNSAGVAADMMAEYVFSTFLHFTLGMPELQADKAAKVWRARTLVPLKGKTLLIVGLGHTGRAVARRARAFGMTVLGTRARPAPMEGVDEVHPAYALDDLLPRADFIAVSTPLTEGTRGLIGASAIAAMKPNAILVDVSRGGVVDQTALARALQRNRIAGAALDVFEVEPLPTDSPLWDIRNLVISPHCSGVYEGWGRASFDLFLENLKGWIEGRELFNVVDPARGY